MFVGDFHTKTHNFIIISCSPTSNYANFSNIFFGLHLTFLHRYQTTCILPPRPKHSENVDDLTFFQDQTILNNVTAHFSAVSQAKQYVKIVTFYDAFTPAPKVENWSYQACYNFKLHQFLKYTHKMLLLEVIQNTFLTTLYFF